MTLEEKIALIFKELFKYEGQIESLLDGADRYNDKVYPFGYQEALDSIHLFINKYSSGR